MIICYLSETNFLVDLVLKNPHCDRVGEIEFGFVGLEDELDFGECIFCLIQIIHKSDESKFRYYYFFFEVIITTPFLPFSPYIFVAASPFKTCIDSMD